MQLLLDYLKIQQISDEPIFVVGHGAKMFFEELNMSELKNKQLIFIQYLETNSQNETYFFNEKHDNYVNLDLNFIQECEYSSESLQIQLMRFFEANKHFGMLTKINVVLSMDELLCQSFIDVLIKERQTQHLEFNLFVKKPKFLFKNMLMSFEHYFEQSKKHFKHVFSIEESNLNEFYTNLNF
ncbi:MAG: hypothetical protein RL207_1999 [Bacteroidota bacterium]|jgi:hypothetical protein